MVDHLLGLSWNGESAFFRRRTSGSAGPEGEASTPEASTLEPLAGLALRYTVVDGPRACLGHMERSSSGTRYIDCIRPVDEGRQCERCRTVDNVLAASMHQSHRLGRGAVDPRLAEHLDQPHRLYVAGFRDGSVKVGTTAGASGGSRLVEQGAWQARYVAVAPNGFVVRDLEDRVTEAFGAGQAVSVRRKLSGLIQPIPDAELARRLADLAKQIHDLVAIEGEFVAVEEADVSWANPAILERCWSDIIDYPLDLAKGAHKLDVVGVCGRVIAATREEHDETFAIDLGRIFGLPLEFGDDVEPDEVRIQGSLF
ncbi:MAG: hypothetical protein ACI8Y4_001244 [Candidatus Poriferisodalaceae bacterium]|jgi:hypothetical protein